MKREVDGGEATKGTWGNQERGSAPRLVRDIPAYEAQSPRKIQALLTMRFGKDRLVKHAQTQSACLQSKTQWHLRRDSQFLQR